MKNFVKKYWICLLWLSIMATSGLWLIIKKPSYLSLQLGILIFLFTGFLFYKIEGITTQKIELNK